MITIRKDGSTTRMPGDKGPTMPSPDDALEARSGCDEPMWDAEQCTCAHNFPLCEYCLMFDSDLEDRLSRECPEEI